LYRLLYSYLTLAVFLFSSILTFGQNATLFGTITSPEGQPVIDANVRLIDDASGTTSGKNGKFELDVPSGKTILVIVSHISFQESQFSFDLKAGERMRLDVPLKIKSTQIPEMVIADEGNRATTMQRIDTKLAIVIPTSGGGIESLIKTLPGVSSNNELSSQYNVRGGNYDENLIYVNDIEIYRPFLIRSGQQEGLSFINPDMVESIGFSAGGFEAKYGDKMSSVLDIKYKRPEKFGGSVSGSLQGGAVHLEGATKNRKFSYLLGARYKSNRYVLGSLDTDGDYRPHFADVQGLLEYDITEKWRLSVLGHYSNNSYNFVPQNRETEFGTIAEALRFTVFFDGQELNRFETVTGAITSKHQINDKLSLKAIGSIYQSNEDETFDVQGQYWLDALDNDLGSDNLGEVAFNRGIGTFLNHARNYLTIKVYNIALKGKWVDGHRVMRFGTKYQVEDINDRLSEWTMIDSSGYSLPINTGNTLEVQDVIKTEIDLTSHRMTGFLQNTWFFNDSSRSNLTVGARFNYWTLNDQFTASPRVNYSYKPRWKKDVQFRVSGGVYYQPPFYRELRSLDGTISKDVRAQLSVHAVLGADFNFKAWSRPFKFVGEAYYKYMDDLVPYEIENVRIRYQGRNRATGFATGIDLKLNGEFVKGVESWASISVMTVQEDLKDDFYEVGINAAGEEIVPGITEDAVAVSTIRKEPGFIPRPTDQRVNFALFFQDYVPRLPQFKMHLNLVFGTGMPFGPPDNERFRDTLRIPPYRRVDIGFSYQLKGEHKKLGPKNPFRWMKSAWVSLEVFNLLQINNTLSYVWISDVIGRSYAVPNYLTDRQLNVKLNIKF
jgi:hypothetical protein